MLPFFSFHGSGQMTLSIFFSHVGHTIYRHVVGFPPHPSTFLSFRFVVSPFPAFPFDWGSIPIHSFQLPFHPRRGPIRRNPRLRTIHPQRHRHTHYEACGCDATSRTSASIHLSSPWTSTRWRWMLDPSNRRTEMGALRRPTAPPPSGCNCFHVRGVTAPVDRSLWVLLCAEPSWDEGRVGVYTLVRWAGTTGGGRVDTSQAPPQVIHARDVAQALPEETKK